MSIPSGIFSHPHSGKLRVSFGGKWQVNNSDPVFTYGEFNLHLRAYVGSGDMMKTALLSVANNTAVLEIDYPGGYALVPIGFVYVSHTLGGAGTVSAKYLSVTCLLVRG